MIIINFFYLNKNILNKFVKTICFMTNEKLIDIATQVRRDIIRMTNMAKSGHPGGSLGCADFLTLLYFEIMDLDPENFTLEGHNEDIFILSNGHISPAFYSVLARRGYFPIDELATFRRINSRLQGHPTPSEHLPGVRFAAGSLGQGLSIAIGCAKAKKLNNDKKIIYSLHGDGELQEGQIWEAALFAGSKKIDNLISTIDYNGQQIDGPVDEVNSLGNLRAKWEAFGWFVLEMNGHDFSDMRHTINIAKDNLGKGYPIMILMHTIMGKGVSFMENDHKWHGTPPNDEQAAEALKYLKSSLNDF